MKLTTAILLLLAAPALGQDAPPAGPAADPSASTAVVAVEEAAEPPPLTAAQRGDFFKLAYLLVQIETQKQGVETALREMNTRLAKGLPCEIRLKNGEPAWACDAVSPEVTK